MIGGAIVVVVLALITDVILAGFTRLLRSRSPFRILNSITSSHTLTGFSTLSYDKTGEIMKRSVLAAAVAAFIPLRSHAAGNSPEGGEQAKRGSAARQRSIWLPGLLLEVKSWPRSTPRRSKDQVSRSSVSMSRRGASWSQFDRCFPGVHRQLAQYFDKDMSARTDAEVLPGAGWSAAKGLRVLDRSPATDSYVVLRSRFRALSQFISDLANAGPDHSWRQF